MLQELKNLLAELEKKRITRIIAIALPIALIWMTIDFLRESTSFNFLHDLLVFAIAVLIEYFIPWGKKKEKTSN